MGSQNETLKTTAESICKVRKMWELPCRGCVLFGYKECSESKGDEPHYVEKHTTMNTGTYGGRPVSGYICHVQVGSPELKYVLT